MTSSTDTPTMRNVLGRSPGRRRPLPGACALLSLALLLAAGPARPADAVQAWLADHAVPIRTLDPADQDFSDLEPVRAAIGTARIVQLGEPSHGAGSSFAAKARLVMFVHQHMGFDVLVWESGFYDLERTQAALRGGGDAVAAAQLGVLKIWSASTEVRPLLDHVRASQASRRPLEMAGMDMQFTAAGAFDDLAADLRDHVGVLADPAHRAQALRATEATLAAFIRVSAYVEARAAHARELGAAGVAGADRGTAMARWETDVGAALRPTQADLDRLQQAAAHLGDLLHARADALAQAHDARRRGFIARTLANLAGYGANIHAQHGTDRPTGADATAAALARENRRDALMAANLRWLVEHGYPGRKYIVWAHNAHVMNAWYGADWRRVSVDPQADAMKPVGVFLADWFGPEVYTIGFTTYEGQDGWVGAAPADLPAASADSLEARLHRLGTPQLFLDLRALRQSPDHPLRQAQTLRLPKYDEVTLPDITRVYDAIIHIDRMAPATLIE